MARPYKGDQVTEKKNAKKKILLLACKLFVYICIELSTNLNTPKTMKLRIYSTAEILTLNALATIANQKVNTTLDPQTFKLINAIVWDVCKQLENTDELKKHGIKINN